MAGGGCRVVRDEIGVCSDWRAEGVGKGTLHSANTTRLGLSRIVYKDIFNISPRSPFCPLSTKVVYVMLSDS